jgi:large subunit ribosomal protein L4
MNLKMHGSVGKKFEAKAEVFGATPNLPLLSQAVKVFLSNQRHSHAKTKTRSDVNRTKKKWYRQKGTGGARHGARTPSIFVGGGVSHGPTGTENWNLRLSASQRKVALVSALSAKADAIIVASELKNMSGKTKQAAALVEQIAPDSKHVLIVLHASLQEALRGTSNIENVLVTQASRLNPYELLLADTVIMTEEAVRMLEEKLAGMEKKPVVVKKSVKKEVVKTVAKAPAKKTAKTVKKAK